MNSLDQYIPRPGVAIPIVTIVDSRGAILSDQQRAAVRYAIQNGSGADIIFAAGTTGEWNRLDNSQRQAVVRIAADECRRAAAAASKRIELWAGITASAKSDTIENLHYAIEIGADAAVVAPVSIGDAADPVDFIRRDIGAAFERAGRMIPIFLYDNAEIAAPGRVHTRLHTREVKEMSRLPYVRGIKVTAGKAVIGNYTRAASHFKSSHEFAIFTGNPYLIFDLFAPPSGVGDRMRHYWNRYLTQRARPYGVVAGAANAMPREWQRAWQVCRQADGELMSAYRQAAENFRHACTFQRGGKPYHPSISCLKAAMAEMGVIESEALCDGTPGLAETERREFARRWHRVRESNAELLEDGWVSEYDSRTVRAVRVGPAHRHG
ncbi:MAG TPA: dihydrodipicolinate synthase family protein [Candidatus Binataceae bacterium]|nr:dihydrodipicolinate synthase family protein [Candidatus Binataceae bacterium]